jgi:hypothetical protein
VNSRARLWLSSVASAVLVASALAVVMADRAAAAPEHRSAICQYRACLLVLDRIADSDGDGVTDIDEKMMGTDPYDAKSYPPTLKVLDLAVSRQLPSFESHLTEIVVLPQQTPDGSAVSTGLGEFKLDDHDGKLLDTMNDITSSLKHAGFEDLLRLRLQPKHGDLTLLGVALANSPDGQAALVSQGMTDLTMWGSNGGKPVTNVAGGSVTINGTTNSTYDISYKDGSRDHEVDIESATDTGGADAVTIIRSYDKDGKLVGTVVIQSTYTVNEDGSKTTNVTTSTYDANGKLTGTKTDSTTVPPDKPDSGCDPHKINCGEDDKYVDPEYIAVSIITPEDIARMELRIKNVGQPGPDNGGGDLPPSGGPGTPAPQPSPTAPESTPQGGFPLAALFDPDAAVTVLAADGEPRFNRVQPDYDPRLAELWDISGATRPLGDPGDASWPT